MPVLQGDDVDLYYEIRGCGPRLLFFNGSGATIDGSAVLLDVLAAHFEVVVHDQRGLGRTGLPRDTTPHGLAPYAADGHRLLEHLGGDPCAVMGISFGGMVAQEFAVTYPTSLSRLALLCTSPGGAGGSSYPLHDLESLSPDERAQVSLATLDTRFTPEYLASHPKDQQLVAFNTQRAARHKSADVLAGERFQLLSRRDHDVWDRLGNITVPTLVAAGRYDGLAPLANSEAIASRVPSSRLRIYEGGHLFFAQDPRSLPEIIDFLAVSSIDARPT